MQVGDLVKYRSHRPSDPVIDQRRRFDLNSTSYNDYGIVIEITDWLDLVNTAAAIRVLHNEGIVFLNQDGNFILAWLQDLKLLTHT
jgi:hypothetical protein